MADFPEPGDRKWAQPLLAATRQFVVETVAEAPTVTQAAAAAVTVAVAERDLVTGSDSRIPFTGELIGDNTYVEVVLDSEGNLLEGATTTGTKHIPRARIDHILVGGAGDTVEVVDAMDYSSGTVDANGNWAEDVLDGNGLVPLWVLRRWRERVGGTARTRGVICRGDSITAGAFGDGEAWPTLLAARRPGIPFAKRGYPGERTFTIAQRQGSRALLATVVGGTIPASGAVEVTLNTITSMWWGANATQGIHDGSNMTGSLNAVEGTLSSSGGKIYFTRTQTGAAMPTPAPIPWVDSWESVRRDWHQIICTGRNNVNDPQGIVAGTLQMVRYQTGGRSLVLGITSRSDQGAGTGDHTYVLAANEALAAQARASGEFDYFDIRAWLVQNGLAAVGLTPTSADTAAINANTIPPALMAADGLHPNNLGYRAYAIGVDAALETLGWFA